MALTLLHSKPYMSKKREKEPELHTVCAWLSTDVAFPVGDVECNQSSSKISILEFFLYFL